MCFMFKASMFDVGETVLDNVCYNIFVDNYMAFCLCFAYHFFVNKISDNTEVLSQ